MGFVLVLRELSKRRLLLVVGALIAAVAAISSVYRLEGGKLTARSLQHSSATTQLLVDAQSSVLGNVAQSFEPLVQRAQVYANFMTSPAVLDLIGQQVGLSGEQIYAAGPVNADEPRVEQEPTALRRNIEVTGEVKPYRLNFETQGNLPTITVNSQAPTTRLAVALANATAVGMERYVASVDIADKVPPAKRVAIRQLGPATGAVDDPGIRKSLAAIVFVAVFVLWCVLLVVAPRFRRTWRASAVLQAAADDGMREPDQGSGRWNASEDASTAVHIRDPNGADLDVPSEVATPVPARSAR